MEQGGAVVKLRVLFLFCYFDDSHVSELEGTSAGGTGTGTTHWHAWTTIPSRGPDQHGTVRYVKSTLCRTVRSFPGFRLQGTALAR